MMSLAHFNGCLNDVSRDYAIDIASSIAISDGDKTTLQICCKYYVAFDLNDEATMNDCVNKLKEYYKNA